MDEAVNARRLAVLLMLSCAGALAHAEVLPDPTRPPASLLRGAGAGPAVADVPLLQSILIAPQQGGRRVAVIDGQTLRVGDKYKGAVLTSMTDSQVVLQSGAKRQVLKLFPAAPTP
ncbi:MAG: hypothetical protein ABIT83_05295 [Massilia sp.]